MEKAPELAAKVAAGTLALDAAEKEVKAAERAATASERSASTPPPMDTLTKHKVIYADPPWRYEFSKTDNRAIENHYPTMTLEDICALQVPAADDAVLYMWATSPKLGEAMKVIESWGFRYATSMVWVKPSMGMGFYARIRHEMLLIATRGNPGTPEPSVRPNSVIEAPRGAHSAKPLLHDQLDAWWPSVTKVELFARQPVDSPWWSTWGNDLAVAA
jgi:N6-adenosine-specific RNA methylase IME4